MQCRNHLRCCSAALWGPSCHVPLEGGQEGSIPCVLKHSLSSIPGTVGTQSSAWPVSGPGAMALGYLPAATPASMHTQGNEWCR